MKNWQKFYFVALLTIVCIILVACGSSSTDVPSLVATPTTDAASDDVLDAEAAIMAFTECLRGEGFEIIDPKIDSKGNVQKPEFAEGFEMSKEDAQTAYEVCGEFLEGITFGRERKDRSEQVDQWVELTACLRDKGYDLDEPTAETLDVWMTDFKSLIDWDDPQALQNYEECNGGNAGAEK